MHGASALVDEMQAIEKLNLEDPTWLVATPHRSRCMRPRSTTTFTALLHVQMRNTSNINQAHALTKHSAGNEVLMVERQSVLKAVHGEGAIQSDHTSLNIVLPAVQLYSRRECEH